MCCGWVCLCRFLWYVWQDRKFDQAAVDDLVHLKRVMALSNEDVSEALRERCVRIEKKFGNLMLNPEGNFHSSCCRCSTLLCDCSACGGGGGVGGVVTSRGSAPVLFMHIQVQLCSCELRQALTSVLIVRLVRIMIWPMFQMVYLRLYVHCGRCGWSNTADVQHARSWFPT